MNYKYFNLNPECYLVLGKNKLVIQNLITKEIIWVDNKYKEIILMAEQGKKVDESNLYLNELEKKGWGFFSEKKFYIDKLRTMNLFNQKKFWKDRPIVFSVVLQLTNSCNMECNQCNKTFCPTCIKLENNNDDLKPDIWKNLINDFTNFGLSHIVLTGGEVTLYKGLDEIIEFALNKCINVTISTNGLNKIETIPSDVEIIINIFEKNQLDIIKKNYSEHNNVTLVNYTSEELSLDHYNNNWKIIEEGISIPNINISNIIKTDLQQFDINKYSNPCLKSRMYICNNLDVVPCFGDKQNIIGNIFNDGISQTIYNVSTEYWNKPKNEFDKNKKCTHCEFRYCCSVCINLDTNINCNYRMESSEWI